MKFPYLSKWCGTLTLTVCTSTSFVGIGLLSNSPVYADTPEEYFSKYAECLVEYSSDPNGLEQCLQEARDAFFKQLDDAIEQGEKRGKEKDTEEFTFLLPQKPQNSLQLTVNSSNSSLNSFFTDITLATGVTSLNLQDYSFTIGLETTANSNVFIAKLIGLDYTYTPFSITGFSDNINRQTLKNNSPFSTGIYFLDTNEIFVLFESEWSNEYGQNVATSLVSYEIQLSTDLDGHVTSIKVGSYGDVRPVAEPTSTLSLLSLGILGEGATIKRKVKRSHSTEKEAANVG